MTDRSQLLRRQLRTRILLAVFLTPATYFLLRVLGVWIGLDEQANPDAVEQTLSAALVLGLPAVACWAHLKTLGDKLSAESERPLPQPS